ncbi:hypothetical protein BHE74_00018742 [Ensete ventricosum]|nr:hypothetical protein BHE74_00018742 [Ensete ventricosum]
MSYEHSFMKKHDDHKLCAKSRNVEFRSIFCAPSRKFKILAIPKPMAYGKSYAHGFEKKHDGHKLCAKSRKIEFRSIFRASSRKFEIMAIPNVLDHESRTSTVSRKTGTVINFAKSCAKSSFDRFFMHYLGNSKYWPFPTY